MCPPLLVQITPAFWNAGGVSSTTQLSMRNCTAATFWSLRLSQKNQVELALKKNKVYVTALALTEQITSSTLDFDLKENEWDDFVELIDKVYDHFTYRLITQYPTLNKSDLQICCLTKRGFSNQVISILMNIQTSSYARRKSRIKQEKMNGLQDERSFEEIISEI